MKCDIIDQFFHQQFLLLGSFLVHFQIFLFLEVFFSFHYQNCLDVLSEQQQGQLHLKRLPFQLFSLILVAGLLVDAVIVTTEYADRRLSKGINRKDAYRDGAARMFWPITSSTATTLMVFLPLLFWPGIVGQFMKYLPITMIIVLISSLLMALIFVPVIGGVVGKKPSKSSSRKVSAPRFYRWILNF